MKPLAHDRLQQFLNYDPETGVFTRRIASGTAKAGDVAGAISKSRYLLISIDNEQYLAHRLAWFYMHGFWPPAHTDHINGDPTDNRIANLRLASAAENGRNRGRPRDNTSGVKGVYWSRKRRKWIAQIAIGSRVLNLGGFDNIDAARAARQQAETQYFGEFRCQAS